MQDREKDKQKKYRYNLTMYLILEFSKRSPYNFDLMLRHLEIQNRFNHYEENNEYFKKHDLKGNQYDTLSYLFYKDVQSIPIVNLSNKYNEHALDFYRECEKESIESYRNCCKHENFRVLWEFYTYERLCCNSSHRIVLDMLQAEYLISNFDKKSSNLQNDILNAEYLTDYNLKKLGSSEFKISFNLDLTQIQIQSYFSKSLFNFDLVGPYKDLNVIRTKNSINSLILKLISGKVDQIDKKKVPESIQLSISSIDVANTKKHDDYHVFRRVNNPLVSSANSTPYGIEELSSSVSAYKRSLAAYFEFASVCFHIIRSDESSSFEDLTPLFDLPSLSILKSSLEECIETVQLKGCLAMDHSSHYTIFNAIHYLRLIYSSYRLLSEDMKSCVKKITKNRPEEDKAKLRTTLSAFTSIKDYLKEISARLDSVMQSSIDLADMFSQKIRTSLEKEVESMEGDEKRSSVLENTIGLVENIQLPSVIRSSAPRILSTFISRYKNSVSDVQIRLSMINKQFN